MKTETFKVADLSLASAGRMRVEWAESRMPVMMSLREKYSKTRPFEGHLIAGCLHVTKETAVLVETLIAAGAEVAWSGCNPLSTNDEVAAALAAADVPIYAWHGMNTEEFYWAIDQCLDANPTLTLDDGADLIFRAHSERPELCSRVQGGTEETTTGVHRLRAMGEDGKLLYPVVAVNDAETKWDFDNVFGTGQSSIDGILRATSILLAGKKFVVAGFGHCGRGVAMRARGMGAEVIVTEVKPTQALKATLEGFQVMTMDEAARIGDVFITATGMKDIIVGHHFESMKDGAVVCNTGHYDCELKLEELSALAGEGREIRKDNEEFRLPSGNRVYVLAKGRLVNLAAAEGHPSEVMDMSFANQFMSLLWMSREGKGMEARVFDIPLEQDREIAALKLKTMGIAIDKLSDEQIAYATDYSAGT
ncbi:MAG: adenosylhomocysteinase [Candidatus Krumholzibacteria bacterium]|nr:adenosylhomocysteinase [Candidatus Krumholzibacteria bacterium]MDP6669761.1 adenosylhomocysteinase [Candidatus Krumholzibacteria bacterium]MDP6797306.1 adenosylhomocysteinase [Candidatus Krumholzibacteria bacterium]MDP7021207.1 adenosylhomocysteinase [Candidatus Krumholzibacteria bacterium]